MSPPHFASAGKLTADRPNLLLRLSFAVDFLGGQSPDRLRHGDHSVDYCKQRFLHTLLGVDHSLPFVALARSRSWSITKTLVVTAICGLIHVLGTLLLCLTALALGQTLGVVESIESFRADFAAIFLLAFGLFSLLRSMNGNTQAAALGKHPTDFWILFLFFAFGPCEFLLPILAIEELSQSWLSFSATVAVFTTITLTTMLMTVALGMKGLDILPWTLNHRRASVLSGLAITGCGLSLLIFGL